MKTVLKLLWGFLLFSSSLWADGTVSPWYIDDANKNVTLNIELFFSSTCPHCHKVDNFFRDIEKKTPYLRIQRHIINEDKNALFRFNQLLSAQHMDDFAVPSIYFCNSRWVGFASAETTGKDLLHAINYCKQQIEKNGDLTPATVDTLQHWANANKFDSGMIESPSAFNYIVTIAMTDAFSPCAFFCFAGFLAFLFIGKDQKTQIHTSLLFILAVMMVHYWQQVHTGTFYEVLPWLRVSAIALGLLSIYFVIRYYQKQSNRCLLFFLAFFIGLHVTAYQQTCVMNWSFVFQQWLNNQGFSIFQAALYQILYHIFYIFPLIIILVLYLVLLKIKRIATLQPRLASIGLLYILAVASYLIVYPLLLSHFVASLLTVLIVIVCGRFINLT